MLKFESRDAPRDVCGGVELGQLLPTLKPIKTLLNKVCNHYLISIICFDLRG